MGYSFYQMKATLTRQLATTFARALVSYESGDVGQLAEQVDILKQITDDNSGLLSGVCDELELGKFMKLFESQLCRVALKPEFSIVQKSYRPNHLDPQIFYHHTLDLHFL